jgi:hypothetical protein
MDPFAYSEVLEYNIMIPEDRVKEAYDFTHRKQLTPFEPSLHG